jgi:hypothetical protein
MSAHDLIDGLKSVGTKVKMFEIEASDITSYDKEIDITLPIVPETMKIHQVRRKTLNRYN